MTNNIQIGDRVRIASRGKGVVKWIGHLPGLSSMRVGIELDCENESCHSGEYDGVSVFACGAHRGVFVKLDKMPQGISLAEGIKMKYKSENEKISQPISPQSKSIKIILVGEEKARTYFAENIYDLTEICVDGLDVAFSGPGLDLFTKLQSLSVRDTLIASIQDVIDICTSLPSLEEIDVSDSFFSSSRNIVGSLTNTGCGNIKTLVMSDCRFSISQNVNEKFPNLKKFVFDNNESFSDYIFSLPIALKDLSIRGSVRGIKWPDFLQYMDNICGTISLESIDLSDNTLGDIDSDLTCYKWMISITSLGIGNTDVTRWDTIVWLRRMFPKLQTIRITENAFYETSNIMKSRQILISIFPSLTLLNSTVVSRRQREEAEKYIASLIDRKDSLVLQVLEEFRKIELLEKYFIITQFDGVDGSISLAPKTVSNMMKLTLHGPMGTVSMRVPRSARSDDFISIVAKKIQWPLKKSQLEIFVAPTECPEDRMKVDAFKQQEIIDLGTSDDWHVFTALLDDRTD